MSNERALLWMAVTGLMAVGLALGQIGAISVAAAIATYLAFATVRAQRVESP